MISNAETGKILKKIFEYEDGVFVLMNIAELLDYRASKSKPGSWGQKEDMDMATEIRTKVQDAGIVKP